MKIKILNGYRGRVTGEQYLSAGEYDTSDNPLIRKCANYLIENGHAVIIEGDAPIEPQAIETPKPTVKRRK